MKSDDQKLIGVHKFEAAGLGKAPFRFVGCSENVFTVGVGEHSYTKAGGSCDYCATSIRMEFHIVSACGKKSKVGCNCIEKVGDAGLIKAYKSSPEFRKMQAEKRNAKAKLVFEELKSFIASQAEKLSSMPHPSGFTDRKTGAPLTLKDYADWMFNNCGNSGKESTLRFLKSLVFGKAVTK